MLNEWLLLIIFVLSAVATPSTTLDVHTIIQHSVEANTKDWNAAPEYDYFERDKENGGTKTYAELMLFGSPYERLLETDGKPLASGEQAEEKRKLEEAIARRRSQSEQQSAERLSKYEKERKRDDLMMQQLTIAFDFKLLGEQKMGTHDVYVLEATPRAGYQPPSMQAEALTGMQGKLWIDKITFQWVRVEAEVTRPVSIEGFLARVEPGTRFELEKAPVVGGIWLPKHFAMMARAKILFLITHKSQQDQTYFGYRKVAQVEPTTFLK